MLESYLRDELRRIPMQHWSHYFPAQVAILRFLEQRYPGNVELTAGGFDEEGPYFRGRGINWFADVLWQQENILELVDAIMTDVVLDLKRRPTQPFHTPAEVSLDAARLALLEDRIIEEADRAVHSGLL